ncbi:hydantoinase/oxoprolinase family protein, partial [Thiohalomonas denitrificans]|uniref:hydantoinase/oxoprolinase family protein n=1 Tax=Thiohalomonas denitrificans TaxID=415747 RepID=UPI0026EC5169
MARVADPLGVPVEEAAEGVLRIANEHMARALRVMSVQRGVDPRQLTLTSFGGAGGLHVCALADELGMTRALVPVHAGVLSALGMLVAPRGRQLSHTLQGPLDTVPESAIEEAFRTLEAEGGAELAAEGVAPDLLSIDSSVDLRYAGQSYTLNVPWTGRAAAAEAFHDRHRTAYGHRLDLPVELVNVRLGLFGPEPELALEGAGKNRVNYLDIIELYGVMGEAEVWRREDLAAGQVVKGPALVVETVATTYIAPRWRALVDPVGNLFLER